MQPDCRAVSGTEQLPPNIAIGRRAHPAGEPLVRFDAVIKSTAQLALGLQLDDPLVVERSWLPPRRGGLLLRQRGGPEAFLPEAAFWGGAAQALPLFAGGGGGGAEAAAAPAARVLCGSGAGRRAALAPTPLSPGLASGGGSSAEGGAAVRLAGGGSGSGPRVGCARYGQLGLRRASGRPSPRGTSKRRAPVCLICPALHLVLSVFFGPLSGLICIFWGWSYLSQASRLVCI